MNASFYKPSPIPDLRRPNFGKFDKDISISLKHTSLAEEEHKTKMSDKFPKVVPIPDLTRPNFGDKDEEVKYTQDNISNAETKL